jgi:site-specific DNA recombinase
MGYGTARGKGGEYDYFFCLGRHTGRTECDLPYLSVPEVEVTITKQWSTVRFTEQEVAAFSSRAHDELRHAAESGSRLITDQRRRLAELERHQTKLLDAYMADAMPVDVLKQRQTQVSVEIADAKRLIENAQTHSDALFARLDHVTNLLGHAEQLYTTAGDEGRQLLNSAVFEVFHIDTEAVDDGLRPVVAAAPLTPILGAVLAGTPAADPAGRREKTPNRLKPVGGSNVTHLAEVARFELARGLNLNPLSRRAH